MKRNLKLAFVFIGTIVGAGLASGQEILQFFTLYGIKGFYGITLCCFIYISISFLIINICYKFNFKTYKDIVIYSLGKRFGFFTDILLSLFIFGGNTIMLSGGGAMLNEYLGINRIWGIFIMALLSFLVAAFSTKGLITINSAIVPISTFVIVILGLLVFSNNLPISNLSYSLLSTPTIKKGWLKSSFLYSSFNIMMAIGVICPMISENKDKESFVNGCIIGSITLTIIAFIINSAIVIYYPGSFYNEIPNLYVAKKFGSLFPLILTLTIWLEMFSTEIGNLYSLSKRIQYSFKVPYITTLLLIILASIPLASVGFSNLITLLYPPFGAISFIFIISLIFRCIKNKISKSK